MLRAGYPALFARCVKTSGFAYGFFRDMAQRSRSTPRAAEVVSVEVFGRFRLGRGVALFRAHAVRVVSRAHDVAERAVVLHRVPRIGTRMRL